MGSAHRTYKERIAEALEIAGKYGTTDGAHHKMWVIDQMVRALVGVPKERKTATDVRGKEYHYTALGRNPEYVEFVAEGDWDEGIAP